MMFLLIGGGVLLRKTNILPKGSDATISRLETYLLIPALNLFNQMTQCTRETFAENAPLMLYGTVIILCAMLLSYPLSRLFVRNAATSPELTYRRNVYKYALTFANYGFVGNFIILGVFGAETFYKYSLLTFPFLVMGYVWGMYILVPKSAGSGMLSNLKKGLLTPPLIALLVGMLIGLLDLSRYVPSFIKNALSYAADCQAPVGLVLAGVVIGGFKFGDLIRNKNVYGATALRLLVLPAVAMLLLKLLGAGEELMTLALIALATPLGMNTIVYPATYGGDTETGASMVMISHALCVATIPLMYYLFIVLL